MEKSQHGITFTDKAQEDMQTICNATIDAFKTALLAREEMKIEYVREVVALEDKVDMLEDALREKHIERLSKNVCNVESGVLFVDALINIERISDHSLNIANYVKDEL